MNHRSLRAAVLLPFLVSPVAAQSMVTGRYLPAWASRIGDVDGNGRDDMLTRQQNALTGNPEYRIVDVPTNTTLWYLLRPAPFGGLPAYDGIGDYDGDGRDDLAYWDTSSCEIVSGADGSTLATLSQPNTTVCGGADFDGDGRADLMLMHFNTATIVSARTGLPLFQRNSAVGTLCFSISPAGDENGDGYEDAALVTFVVGLPYAMMEIVRGPLGVSAGAWNNTKPVGDVTGDGNADFLSAPHPSVLAVAPFVLAGGSLTNAWTVPGLPHTGYATVPQDVDGDGFADLAISDGSTVQLLSGATHAPLPGVVPTQLPVPQGDLDGDGRAESTITGLRYEWVDPALPIVSRMVRRGTPGTTSLATRPMLVTRGHCGLGRTAFFDMRGGLPNGLVLLVYGAAIDIDVSSLGAPNNRCYTSLAGAFAFVTDGGGVAQYQATMPVTPSLLGASLSLQSIVVDAAANPLGLVTSNAIDITTNN